MSILDRYILNTFARNLALVLLTLISLYGLIEFLEKIDDFIEYRAELKYYLLYPLHLLPVIISNSMPMAVLLATFATVGGFSRSSQLTAMLSGGISFNRISRPLFQGGLALAVLIIIANLWLVPWASRESNYILLTKIKGYSPQNRGYTLQKSPSKDIYFREDNRIISVNQAFPDKSLVFGLTIIEFNSEFMPVKRIQAERAIHVQNGSWRLDNAAIWNFSPKTRSVSSFDHKPELLIDLKRPPSGVVQFWTRPEDLTLGELLQFTAKLRNEGYDPKAYQVETHMRFAKAAVPVIMVLIGIPFALQRGRNASFSLGIVISLVIFVVYFIFYAVFAVFGAIAILPPLIAAWAANILMALIGGWFYLRLQN